MMQSQTSQARVYVVDDEQVIRKGLKLLLSHQPGLQVCGETDAGSEAAEQIEALRPDLAIVDVTLKEDNGLKTTRLLRQKFPALKILIFSMHSEASIVQAAFRAGADGYITKEEAAEKLIEAIRVLLQGKRYVGKNLVAKMSADCPAGRPPQRLAPHPIIAAARKN